MKKRWAQLIVFVPRVAAIVATPACDHGATSIGEWITRGTVHDIAVKHQGISRFEISTLATLCLPMGCRSLASAQNLLAVGRTVYRVHECDRSQWEYIFCPSGVTL